MVVDGGAVNGVLIDASVLFTASDASVLGPAADSLLRKLRYSKIPTAVFDGQGLPPAQVSLLEEMGWLNLISSLIRQSSSIETVANEVSLAWGNVKPCSVLVVSNNAENLSLNLRNSGWVTVILCSPRQVLSNDVQSTTGSGNSSTFAIDKLEELPSIICHLNKELKGDENLLVVGYKMKPSREEDFAKRGAFPLRSTENGLIFFPLNYELPLSSQLQGVDILLHKATDEIVDVEMSRNSKLVNKITFTDGMRELQRYTDQHPDLCVIDPYDNIYPVVDRLKIQEILCGLESLSTKSKNKIRGPHFLKVDSFEESNLEGRFLEAKLSLPNIVKPQVACGVADAHSMAIVFKVNDYKGLNVPLPAVIQEYVDHSSCLYKFYVLGEKIYYAVKKSTPNAITLMSFSEKNGFKPILFDSLKSLPTDKKTQQLDSNEQMDLELVTDAANWLRNILDLTIFGFDVVVQDGTCEHVIVDVNYLPSFKEIPDDLAVPAFWEAIKWKFMLHRNSRSARVH